MHRILRLRPSPATVIACAALAVSLGGTSYAAVVIPRNSVGTAQLKANAVTSGKVKNFTLSRVDFRRGTVLRGPRGLSGPPGAIGPVGPAGPAGPTGPTGAPASASAITVRSAQVTVPGNTANGAYATRVAQVNCESNERAIAGGATWNNDSNDQELFLVYSQPVLSGTKTVGWRARGGSDITSNATLTVGALCEKIS